MDRSWRFAFVATSVAAIWVTVVLASIMAPPLISGSQHEEIPIVAMTGWLWALCATGFVLLAAGSRVRQREHWIGATVAIVVIWAAVGLLSIYGPELVTGTDPTRVPLVAMLAPIAGVIGSGYVSIFAAIGADETLSEKSGSGVTIDVMRHEAAH